VELEVVVFVCLRNLPFFPVKSSSFPGIALGIALGMALGIALGIAVGTALGMALGGF
jgi:hypothetical protein